MREWWNEQVPLNRVSEKDARVHFHIYMFIKTLKAVQVSLQAKYHMTQSSFPAATDLLNQHKARNSAQFGNVVHTLQDLVLWRFIHTFP